MINFAEIENRVMEFRNSLPFPHMVIDGFVEKKLADSLTDEFPNIGDSSLYNYSNPLEKKSALNDWNKFPPNTYKLFEFLCSDFFVSYLSKTLGIKLYPDFGLHGGGWHMHPDGGKLNPHLDYNIHPKLGLQRRINLIIYLSKDWLPEFGGHFGLWSNNPLTNKPEKLEKEVEIKFNRAVLFDTTYKSWHGLSRQVNTGGKNIRKSLAVYYLCDPPEGAEIRERALYAATEDQKDNPEIEDLIQKRAHSLFYKDHYISKSNEK
ncbi:2OG-Fe(II) oxygenase [Aquiflexum sp. LQ15W]|uniref:2OG-Fe(II) oxygenase n=1 Tax=Cognataquiflexum nitidum TaxID=2922272 RepID=UPI001F139984|nr:2OG-Fe(II) oxygenase [Cognataquiflexum nitidum]MCH6199815.1 2OG-Fe(II) oxygenase [Cognataquiflexum nitidum]